MKRNCCRLLAFAAALTLLLSGCTSAPATSGEDSQSTAPSSSEPSTAPEQEVTPAPALTQEEKENIVAQIETNAGIPPRALLDLSASTAFTQEEVREACGEPDAAITCTLPNDELNQGQSVTRTVLFWQVDFDGKEQCRVAVFHENENAQADSPYLYSFYAPLSPTSASQQVKAGMTREQVQELLPDGVNFDEEGTALLCPLEDDTLLWVTFDGDEVTDTQLWK